MKMTELWDWELSEIIIIILFCALTCSCDRWVSQPYFFQENTTGGAVIVSPPFAKKHKIGTCVILRKKLVLPQTSSSVIDSCLYTENV